MTQPFDIGMVGLGVMGRNLLLWSMSNTRSHSLITSPTPRPAATNAFPTSS
jgi:hypothetical protein